VKVAALKAERVNAGSGRVGGQVCCQKGFQLFEISLSTCGGVEVRSLDINSVVSSSLPFLLVFPFELGFNVGEVEGKEMPHLPASGPFTSSTCPSVI
jgi:hypothetical protein